MINYTKSIADISVAQLGGFFVGWRAPLTPEKHYLLLCGSTHFVAAIGIGFVTALSDGVNSSFIPLLEVLPEYQGRGISSRLVELILEQLEDITNIDLTCGPELQPFYERFKMLRSTAWLLENTCKCTYLWVFAQFYCLTVADSCVKISVRYSQSCGSFGHTNVF